MTYFKLEFDSKSKHKEDNTNLFDDILFIIQTDIGLNINTYKQYKPNFQCSNQINKHFKNKCTGSPTLLSQAGFKSYVLHLLRAEKRHL